MKKPLISYVLISLSVSIMGLNACGSVPGAGLELAASSKDGSVKQQQNNSENNFNVCNSKF